jgi:aspartyl-tRNA(Asn)/glutamyl-tRNA(Gln) amidotransferase subunit A
MSAAEITRLDATALADAYRTRRLSPVEATKVTLDRVARLNPTLNAFYEVDAEQALAAAARAEARWAAGTPLGPLDGVPVSIKDHLQVEGFTTPRGSFLASKTPSDFDCPVATRLREAGAVILGKTTMPELSVIPVTESVAFGITRNPWDPACSPGGSSGGAAAAVAAGLGPLASGRDGGGSIRLPASFTNLVGLKPTLGRVPYWPGQTDRTVAGPIARSVRDVALAMEVIARPDGRDWMELPADEESYAADLARGVKGLRLAWSPTFGFQRVDPEVRATCEAAVARLAEAGAEIEEVERVGFDVFDIYLAQATLRLADLPKTMAPGDLDRFPPVVLSVLRHAAALTPRDLQEMFDRRNALGDALLTVLARHDAILSPAAPFTAPRIGELYPEGDIRSDRNRQILGFSAPFNLVHMPAVSVPAGFSRAGLPIGLQIAGRKLSERLLLRIAAAVEAAGDAKDRFPSLG